MRSGDLLQIGQQRRGPPQHDVGGIAVAGQHQRRAVKRLAGDFLGRRAFGGNVAGAVPDSFARGFAEDRALLQVVLQRRELMVQFPGLNRPARQFVPTRVLGRYLRCNKIDECHVGPRGFLRIVRCVATDKSGQNEGGRDDPCETFHEFLGWDNGAGDGDAFPVAILRRAISLSYPQTRLR